MFLENKGKGVTILSAPGYKNLILKPGEAVELEDFVCNKFKGSIDVAVQSFGLVAGNKAPKKEEVKKEAPKEVAKEAPKKEVVEEECACEDLESSIERAKNDVLLAEEQFSSLPEGTHHKTRKAAERRLGKAKQALESLLGGL